MKYIIIQKDAFPVALVFSDIIQHRDALAGVRGEFTVKGAGFCSIRSTLDLEAAEVRCWGESDSLRVKSRGEADAADILFSLTLPCLAPQPAEAA